MRMLEDLDGQTDHIYKAFHRFGQAKFPEGGLILGSGQFSILP